MKLESYLITYIKINSRWMKDFKYQAVNFRTSRRN